MESQQLTREQFLLLYGQHLEGNKRVTEFLINGGVDLSDSVDEENAATKTELQSQPKDSKQKQIPPLERAHEEDLDFPIFLLMSKERIQDQNEQSEFEGEKYSAKVDTLNEYTGEKPPLESWDGLYHKLNMALRIQSHGHQISIVKTVNTIATGTLVDKLPVKEKLRPPRELFVYVDLGVSSHGVIRDALEVEKQIKKHHLSAKVRSIYLFNGAQGKWKEANDLFWRNDPIAVPDSVGTGCLIITGQCAKHVGQWKTMIKRLHFRQIAPVWLTTSGFSTDVRAEYRGYIVPWGRQDNASHSITPLKLITVLMMTTRIVHGVLLRNLINLLKIPSSAEIEFWNQHSVEYFPGPDHGEVHLSSVEKQKYIKYLNTIDRSELANCCQLIEQHLEVVSPSQLHEHRLHMALLLNKPLCSEADLQESEHFIQGMGRNLELEGEDSSSNALFLQETIQQFDGYIEKADSKVQQSLAVANAYCYQHGITNEVNSALAERVQRYLGKEQAAGKPLNIYQKGDTLVAYFKDDIEESPELQTKVEDLSLMASTEHVKGSPLLIEEEGKQKNLKKGIKDKQPIALSEVTDFVLQSQFEALSITKRTTDQFYWAKSLSITSKGVMIETNEIVLYWSSSFTKNNNVGLFDKKNMNVMRHDRESGCFISIKSNAPKWLHDHCPQLDQRGLYVELTYNQNNKNIPFKLRYIPPGHFLMGSPEDEPQREDDETQHPVELTQGCWMGETTVTQALWQAVMGNNPSYFKAKGNEKLPVEQVSWDDCIKFCQKLSNAIPGITLELPTEAEWEYACRAGSKAPFHTGDELTAKDANFYDDEKREVGKERGDGKTIDVTSFEPNAWGLKQMHGNVDEWCADGLRDFVAESVVNPIGPMTDESLLVLRGGSWTLFARDCRSALRFGGTRGGRSYVLGLRLCSRSEVLFTSKRNRDG